MKTEFKLSEYSQCSKDFVYFCNIYIKIKDTNNKIINFNLYDYQRNTIDSIEQNYMNLIVKARQMGITKLLLAYSLWNMLFKNNFRIIHIFTKNDILKVNKEISEKMYNNLPSFLKKDIIKHNKYDIEFSNGSIINYFYEWNETCECSSACDLLLVDEAQYISNLEYIFISLASTITSKGRVVFYSTPSPENTFFKKLWNDESNLFNKIQIPWFFNRSRTHKYYNEMKSYIGSDIAKHELEAKF